MSGADPDSRPIDREAYRRKRSSQCKCCGGTIDTPSWNIKLSAPHVQLEHWSFCEACFQLLVATLETEIDHGPDTPPPEAWTKVRKLRAARRRRWGKADP